MFKGPMVGFDTCLQTKFDLKKDINSIFSVTTANTPVNQMQLLQENL